MINNTETKRQAKRLQHQLSGKCRSNVGFTLIEVLIALMIVGMALPALMVNVQSVSDNTSYLEEKTYAYWIAENRLQEIKLLTKVAKTVSKTKQKDTIEYGGRDWFWQVDTQSTDYEGMYQVEVKVGLEEGTWLATVIGVVFE